MGKERVLQKVFKNLSEAYFASVSAGEARFPPIGPGHGSGRLVGFQNSISGASSPSGLAQDNILVVFPDFTIRNENFSAQKSGRMGDNVEFRSLSDQRLLRLDERVCLRNRNLKQVGDSLRGCQREPMQI